MNIFPARPTRAILPCALKLIPGALFTLLCLSAEETPVFELEDFIVRAQHNPVVTLAPTVSVLQTREDFTRMNVITPEDTLQYAPNLFVRKRYIGDRNGVLAIRGASPFQNARSLVYADGVLLSNLLENRWNGAPRWQVVAAEEIEATEVIYGPYAAEYSGNAMNGVVRMETRQPVEREATIQGTVFTQSYKDYGVDDDFGGYRGFVSFGDRVGRFSYYGFYQRLVSEAQPQSLVSRANMTLAAAEPAASGVLEDRDSRYRERFVLGARGFNQTEQNLVKLKFAYELSETVRAQLTLAWWDTYDDSRRIENFLTDASGDPLWSGNYQFDGRAFDIRSSDWAVSERWREDALAGLTLEGELGDGWTFQNVFTTYGILRDESRTSNQNPADPAFDGSGRVARQDDTWWLSANLKLGRSEWFGREDLSGYVGYHFNHYHFTQNEWNSSDYASGLRDGAKRNEQAGVTRQHALFAQAEWNFAPAWTLTPGLRLERWEARNGRTFDSAGAPLFRHPDRREHDLSPKISLAYEPSSQWSFRASVAAATRYPIVTELFQGDPDDRARVVANPELLPEQVLAGTVMAEHRFRDSRNFVSLALFRHEETDTIYAQRAELDDGTTLSTFVNIDRTRSQGVELSGGFFDLFGLPLDLNANISYNDARILRNRIDRSIEGNDLPRVPDWRANLLATWHVSPQTDFSAGFRFATDAFDDLDNGDSNARTFGGISRFRVVNLRLTHRFENGLTLAAGVDNLTNERYWMAHPFPQRSYSLDATWRF